MIKNLILHRQRNNYMLSATAFAKTNKQTNKLARVDSAIQSGSLKEKYYQCTVELLYNEIVFAAKKISQ